MKKIKKFINQYNLSKTLRFKLLPYGKTMENFNEKLLLSQDEERSELYAHVKKYIDEYHKFFIDSALSQIDSLDVDKYATLFFKNDKNKSDEKELKAEAEKLRKKIAKALESHSDYRNLFSEKVITEILPEFLDEESKKEEVKKFEKFTTYFVGFHENRKNIYTYEEKSTGIAYRCINDNLPKFLTNTKSFERVVKSIPKETIDQLNDDFVGLIGVSVETLFNIDSFSRVLTQKGISLYNQVVGGYTTFDGKKIQGLNEYINLYNQTHSKDERLPKMKALYKQILSDRETVSFLPDKFNSDDEVISSISQYYNESVCKAVSMSTALFEGLEAYDLSSIWYKNDTSVSSLSNKLSGSWHFIKDAWLKRYSDEYQGKAAKDSEKFFEQQEKDWKNTIALSLLEINGYLEEKNLVSVLKDNLNTLVADVENNYLAAKGLLCTPYVDKSLRLAKNDNDIILIKNLLDSVKELERFLKPFAYRDSILDRDERFYSEYEDVIAALDGFSRLYDKVRNYVTQKPYSKDKIKLNFDNPQFLAGWDRNKESDYRSALLRKDGNIYLAVMAKSASSIFKSYPTDNDNGWEKIDYKLLPGPNKMLPKVLFAKSNLDFFAPSKEILRIYETKTFLKGDNFSLEDCHKMIQFYQDSIAIHKDWSKFEFKFKKANEYADIAEFYRDVATQGYKMQFRPISEEYLNQKVDSGELYLFQIYSKDFSPYSKGTPNLHTMYFKMLFDERNLENVVYQLNGGAEMFYRLPSIKNTEKVIHPKNQPIANKNPHTEKRTSVFEYDLIKDKRFTEAQFSLHCPITLNFKAVGNERINLDVRKALKYSDNNYVIGIDRGERHLVYISVIDGAGKIVEQFSLNEIVNGYKGVEHKVNYHDLLDKKEKERQDARQNWKTVENIKELKEGYISQVVHKICQLVVKYDAIIAMEDLNVGFKTGRFKVEKQVYQKLEKMLIDKLNYYVDKQASPDACGGLLNAYQLTEKFESFSKMGKQNGFIFYVPAWLTSKIDPTTGFVDLLKPKYTSGEESISFVKKFDCIRYNSNEDMLEFSFDYNNFPKGSIDYIGAWTVYSNGERIETVRDESANGNFVSRTVNLTDEWKKLFASVGIELVADMDLKDIIIAQNEKSFFQRFMYLLRLTLQMRNSISNGEIDYLISPVKNSAGEFYDSRNYNHNSSLPSNADANGAYNIARKALWAIGVLKNTHDDELIKAKLAISNKDWLSFAQNHE